MVRTYSGPQFPRYADYFEGDKLACRVIDEIPMSGPNFKVLMVLASRLDKELAEPYPLEQWALDSRIPLPEFKRRVERLIASSRVTCQDGRYGLVFPEVGRL